jgi:hypothetical protein
MNQNNPFIKKKKDIRYSITNLKAVTHDRL